MACCEGPGVEGGRKQTSSAQQQAGPELYITPDFIEQEQRNIQYGLYAKVVGLQVGPRNRPFLQLIYS